MTTILLLNSALIGTYTALILRIIFLLLKKQPRNIWQKPVLKAGLSGAVLGCAGGWIGYLTASWVTGYSQHWLVLLLSACLSAFIFGWLIQMLLERVLWRRLKWG
jgi:hypothetical protein